MVSELPYSGSDGGMRERMATRGMEEVDSIEHAQ